MVTSKRVLGSGSKDAKICILTDFPRVSAAAEGRVFTPWEFNFINNKLIKYGLNFKMIRFESIVPFYPNGKTTRSINPAELDSYIRDTKNRLNDLKELNVIVPLGNLAMKEICGKSSIDKWQLSLLPTLPSLNCKKCIPTFHPDRIIREYSLQVFFELALIKAQREAATHELHTLQKNYLINQTVDETISFLEEAKSAEHLSIDIETSRGRINTFGIATTPHLAIAMGVLPSHYGTKTYKKIWELIAHLCESDQKKILQNNIYENMYLSKYGIRLNNVYHDTMWAQKVLYPELKMGLDNVGRIYTDMPYWKDDNKNWNNIKDWNAHYLYNCKDTTGTMEGMFNQKKDLEERGMDDLFYNYIMKLAAPIAEMCNRGLLISEEKLRALNIETGLKIQGLIEELNRETYPTVINPKSPIQVKKYYTEKGYQLYKRYDTNKKKWVESTNQTNLKKMRKKYKEDKTIPLLIELSTLNKAKSSYLDLKYDTDNRMRYTLSGVGTETGRFAGHKDPWDKGINPQTAPGGYKGINVKSIFTAPQGMTLFQVDLKQAESRFVAYDSNDQNLIDMLEDDTKDIHKYVAAEIFQKPQEEITKVERQLGKKSGHGANYNMGVNTFIEQCVADDITLNKKEAENVLESYHRLFPGIRKWHQTIRDAISKTRLLTNPLGRQRYFYDRLDDNLFRQAYAYRPQSSVPDIVNKLMLYALKQREQGKIKFNLLLQVHDSLLFEVEPKYVEDLSNICHDLDSWHPEIHLAGGQLRIPVDVEVGKFWGEVKPL